MSDEARIVVYGEPGYYSTGRIDSAGGQHNHGGYFSRKVDAVAHARILSAEYRLPVADETVRGPRAGGMAREG